MRSNTTAQILVTGGAGMLGANLVKRLADQEYRVVVVDNLWRGKIENLLSENGEPVIDMSRDFFDADLTIPDVLTPLLAQVDYVYHLADVVSGIEYVYQHEGFVFRQNVLINSNVIDSVSQHKHLKGFIYPGTACSFPREKQTGIDAGPLKEEDQYPASPESAYGWSKLMGEYETLLMEKEHGIPVSVLIFHNIYGTPCDSSRERSQVIPALIRKAILHPEEPFVV